MDLLLTSLLAWGMDSRSFIEQGILVHNANDGTFLGLYHTSHSANIYVGTLVIVNSSDINLTSSFEYGSYIITSYTAMSTSIDKGQ
jgi:type IV secretory pathway protease TraF